MWNYEKRLEYPINIKRTDAAMAKAIISQFGGPDGKAQNIQTIFIICLIYS